MQHVYRDILAAAQWQIVFMLYFVQSLKTWLIKPFSLYTGSVLCFKAKELLFAEKAFCHHLLVLLDCGLKSTI